MIVNKPIKVFSSDVANMKDEARQILTNLEGGMSIK